MLKVEDIRLKVVFLGQPGSGKTTLIYLETQRILMSVQSTIALDYKKKTYQLYGIEALALLWDTAGAQRFTTLKTPIYRNSHAICVCFSLNDRESYEKVPEWIVTLRLNEIDCPLFLVGCKADLEHVVTAEQIEEYASKQGIPYFQTSARQGTGVTNSIQNVVEAAYDYYKQKYQIGTKLLINPPAPKANFCWS